MVSVWVTGCAAGVGVDAGVAVGPLGTVLESGPQARVNSNGITGGAVPNQVLRSRTTARRMARIHSGRELPLSWR